MSEPLTAKDPIGFKAGDTNLYGYVVSDPTNRTDRTRLWAVGIGLSGTGGLGGGAGGGRMLVIDGNGNIGVVDSAGAGGFAGSGSVGVQIQITNADRIYDLREWSLQSGGSVGEGLKGGIKFVVGGNGNYEGINFNLGVGAGTPVEKRRVGRWCV